MKYEEHFKESAHKRENLWKSIGNLYTDVVGNLINPAFMGGPRWPSLRQAHIGISVNQGTIIATDGLSDPYDDYDTNEENQAYNGLGLELYLVTHNNLEDIPAIISSWELNMLTQVSSTAASNPNLINMLNDYQYLSMTINGQSLPEGYVNENGSGGVLLGLPNPLVPAQLELSIEHISLVNIVLLKPSELQYIMDNGEKGRLEVADELISHGFTSVMSQRPSVK